MKLTFSSMKNGSIFEDDFLHLNETNGTIQFRKGQANGGIAVVYAPNGTGKSSFAGMLASKGTSGDKEFSVKDENGNVMNQDSEAFHVIMDQLDRNIIKGKTTDYLVGSQIRREYELRNRIFATFRSSFDSLIAKYKNDFMVTKVGDTLLVKLNAMPDPLHRSAYTYIRSLVKRNDHGKDIDPDDFVTFLRNNTSRLDVMPMEAEKRSFVISDLVKTKVVSRITSLDPHVIQSDEKAVYIERYDDAIGILHKYHSLDSCVVCDSHDFDGSALLVGKQASRQKIYEELDQKTRELLDHIVAEKALLTADPFGIKKIVSDFIADGSSAPLVQLQRELEDYVQNIGNEMINCLLGCFDGTDLFRDYDAYNNLTKKKPKLDTEELMFLRDVISENIEKEISIDRDEEDGRNYKLKIGDKDLLGTSLRDMELSNGEQNFISLAFELLYARHSEKEYVVIDDPISSFDSVYKNKIAFCIIKFLENKRQIILTHNTDLIRLLDVQLNNCFHLYILNNVRNGANGFIPVSIDEKNLLINMHALISLFQNKENALLPAIRNRRQFMMAMVPFLRGYANISLDPNDHYGRLSGIMHGYEDRKLNVIELYNHFFGYIFEDVEMISTADILGIDCTDLDILDKEMYPLLADTLEQTLIYYYLRMKVEKELVDIFRIGTSKKPMLNQIIRKAFEKECTGMNSEQMRAYRVFFTSRKTLLNEFNHFEGNMNIFQPAIDIEKSALQKEVKAIEDKLREIRATVTP